MELAAFECLENRCLICQHSSAFIFDWIFFNLAGNKDNYDISEEFEIRPDRTKDCGVNCP